MFRFVVLAVVLAVALADLDELKKKCHRLGHPKTIRCCKTDVKLPIPDVKPEELKECFEISKDPHSCEHDICIGKKRGFVTDDGKLDKDAFLKVLTEDFKEMTGLIENIKEKCIDGDLSSYGSSPDACELMKMKYCIHVQFINDCKEWDDTGVCAGIKDLVKECAKTMP